MEWERFDNVLVVVGAQADQARFNDALYAFIDRASAIVDKWNPTFSKSKSLAIKRGKCAQQDRITSTIGTVSSKNNEVPVNCKATQVATISLPKE